MKRLLLTLSGVLMASHPVQSAPVLLLNEVHLNPPNADGLGDRNFEYMELRSFDSANPATPTAQSTDGFSILIVNNDRWDFKTNDQGVEVPTKLNLGELAEAWSLDDFKTGANGLLLLGDKYSELPKGGPWAGFIDPLTEVGDPVGMGDGNIRSNDGLSIFLVTGFTTLTPNAGTPQAPVVDFDVDDNGVLDWLQNPKPVGGYGQNGVAPFTIIDQIGTRDRNEDPWPPPPAAPTGVTGIAEPYTGLANGFNANLGQFWISPPNNTWSMGDRDPDSFSRNATLLTPSAASAWYGGKFPDPAAGTDPANSIAYRTNRVFGLANGQATPGRANLSVAPADAEFRINEVNLDPTSDRYQYVEIVNTNTTPGSRSLTGWWLVLVDSNVSTSDNGAANKVGAVIEEWDLSAMATGSNGLLLIADDAASSYTAFEDYVPAETGKGDPAGSTVNPKSSGFSAGNLGSKAGFSMFLIKGYKTNADITLSEGRDLDTNDDGVLDALVSNPNNPAAAFASAGNLANVFVKDSVGFDMAAPLAGGAGKTYAVAPVDPPTNLAVSTINLRTVFPVFVNDVASNRACDNFSRKTSGGVAVTTNTSASWYGGEFPSGAGFNLGYQPPVAGEGDPNVNPLGITHFGGFRGAATPGRPNLSAPINPAAPPIPADIRLNEVMFDPTTFPPDINDPNKIDGNRDYIELVSTDPTAPSRHRALAYLDGYWIVVVDNAGGNRGLIKTGAPLDGQTTGSNGLLLLGDNYDSAAVNPYVLTEGTMPPSTATIDPIVAFGGDDINNNGATILLIRGPAYDHVTTPNGPFKVGGPITVNQLKPSGDLDPNNDGVLLPSSDWLAPGSQLVDAVSIGSVNPGAEYGYLTGGSWLPDCAARTPGNTSASSSGAWYFGEVDQTENLTTPSTQFTTFSPASFRGHASPGRWNHTAPVPDTEPPGTVLINEVHFNPAGGDGNFEFIELLDKNGASRSLNRYTLLMIDNVKNNTGTIQRAWPLDGARTGSNGLVVITNGSRATAPWNVAPWKDLLPAATELFDPPGRDDLVTGFGDATIGAESDNQSVMLLLVRNFSSTIGADYDFIGGANNAGDGVFDGISGAWEGGVVHDSVVLRSFLPAEPPSIPLAGFNGFTYNLADLSGTFFPAPATLFYHPETVARFLGNFAPNTGAAWYGGDLTGGPSGKLGTDTVYITNDPTHPPVPAGFTGHTTPGQPNVSAASSGYDAWAATHPGIGGPADDFDNDNFSNLLEYAGGSIPTSGKSIPPSTQILNGTTLTVSWAKGPEATVDSSLTWTIEASTNLVAGPWSTAGVVNVQNGAAAISGDFILTPGAPKTFFRLKVVRTP